MIKIVTDSACDLPSEWVKRYDITVVPIHIRFGTEHFLDRVTIDASAFYERIARTGEIPTTSQPSVGEFAAVCRQLAAEGADAMISMHVTGRLGGTVRSAELAAQGGQARWMCTCSIAELGLPLPTLEEMTHRSEATWQTSC